MPDYYVNRHDSQYDTGLSARTRRSGCTWTTGSNGATASTRGAISPNPDQLLARVSPSEESSPTTPGWSLADLDKALTRVGVAFEVRSGAGWGAVRAAHDAGYYVALQGDSDQFGNGTCSGVFDGDHCVGIHPDESPGGSWRIDDPICPDARYETETTLRRYAEKLAPTVHFGVFSRRVPIRRHRARVGVGFVHVYRVIDDRIVSRQRQATRGFSAWCSAPDRYVDAASLPAATYSLVKLLDGSRKGLYIGSQYAREVWT